MYLIGRHLFGCPVPPLTEWPYHHDLRVLGISDGAGFAARLGPKFNYENTNYHIEPFFDVKAPPQRYLGAAMVICSEVLEHVAHPVEPAFSGLCSVLKPGGLLVFSVPWTTGETAEHFPELNIWRFEQEGKGKILINLTADGREQVFRRPCFHGGVGETLEMRVFGVGHLIAALTAAGFRQIRIMHEDVLENGIRIGSEISRPITCYKHHDRGTIGTPQ